MASGLQLQFVGMEASAEARQEDLAVAQDIARKLWQRLGATITIEDVRIEYERTKGPWALGNAAGSVFSKEDWQFMGYTKAKRDKSHARPIGMWRLRDGG